MRRDSLPDTTIRRPRPGTSAGASAGLAAAMLVCASSIAAAQAASDAGRDARFHLGPLALTPSINVTQGMDSNVFNVENESEQKRDFTAEVAPQLAIWLKAGAAGVTGRSGLTASYFQINRDQGSVGTSQDVTIDVALWRFRPYVRRSFFTVRNRPSLDIDVRARYATDTWVAGSEVRVSGRTTIAIDAERQTTRFDNDATFLGTSLRTELNRTRDQVTTSLRYDLTPLTTLEVNTELGRDVFDASSLRNARSVRVSSALNFKPFALLSGRAELGYLRFNPSDPALQDHDGLSAAMDLSYVLRDATRFSVGFTRGVEYSFDVAAPYYVLTGLSVNVTQRLGARWFATGGANQYRLAYQTVAMPQGTATATTASSDRSDTTFVVGGDLAYALTRRSRIGVRTEKSRRESIAMGRSHSGVRTFMTLSITL